MDQILLRDGPYCVWCGAALDNTPGSIRQATTEHMVPRIKGGPSWVENELAACRRCNGERGHQSVSGWVADCRGLGRSPRVEVVIAAMERLQAAITEHGGQRRARPYITSQLRRLRRM